MSTQPKWAVLTVVLDEATLKYRERVSLTNLYGMEQTQVSCESFANACNLSRLRDQNVNVFYVALPRHEALGFIALQKEIKEAAAKEAAKEAKTQQLEKVNEAPF